VLGPLVPMQPMIKFDTNYSRKFPMVTPSKSCPKQIALRLNINIIQNQLYVYLNDTVTRSLSQFRFEIYY